MDRNSKFSLRKSSEVAVTMADEGHVGLKRVVDICCATDMGLLVTPVIDDEGLDDWPGEQGLKSTS